MKTRVDTPQSRCRAGFARADITPPVGIYHRMWGAALHDRVEGVHRPLTATAMYLEQLSGSGRKLVIGLDHCILDGAEIEIIRSGIAGLEPEDIAVSLSHTHGSGWMTRTRSSLPGGDLSPWIGKAPRSRSDVVGDFARFVQTAAMRYPQLPASLCKRFARAYGARIEVLLAGYEQDGGLGAEIAPGLFEAELNYLYDFEWARSADDVLWRRSKLGLHFSAAQRAAVAGWCATHWPNPAAQPSTPASHPTETAWS